jgi:hypothetical protein
MWGGLWGRNQHMIILLFLFNNLSWLCGGPRTTMMSNIASPSPYDTGAHHTPEPENIRLPTIWRCARRGAVSDVAVVAMSLHGQGAEQSQESVSCQLLGVDRCFVSSG